jgi:hypothetical protein
MIDENRLKEDFDHIDEDAPNQGLANNEELIAALRSDILSHLEALALPALNGNSNGTLSKEAIRASHAFQRREILQHEKAAFGNYWPDLLQQFADGVEVIPEAIEPELVPVVSGEETGYLFRFAALLWSVPVSRGYGRRMRYLVRDRNNGKLIGILGRVCKVEPSCYTAAHEQTTRTNRRAMGAAATTAATPETQDRTPGGRPSQDHQRHPVGDTHRSALA